MYLISDNIDTCTGLRLAGIEGAVVHERAELKAELDRVMADRKMSLKELAERVEISNVNLSNLKTGKVRAIRFSTLDAICRELHCQPGDILEYVEDEEDEDEKV